MAQRKVRKPRARKPRAPKVKYDNEDVKPSKAIKTKQSQKQSITLTLPAQQAQQPAYFMNPQQPQQPQQPHQPYVINIQQPQQQPQHADVIREIFHEAQQPQGGNILGRAIDAGAQLGVAYAPAVRDVLGGVGQHVALPILQATGRAVRENAPAIAGGILEGAGNVAAAAVPVVGNILGQAGQTAAAAARVAGNVIRDVGAGIRDMYIADAEADERQEEQAAQYGEQLRQLRQRERAAIRIATDDVRRAAEGLQLQEQRADAERATQLWQRQHKRDTDILDQQQSDAEQRADDLLFRDAENDYEKEQEQRAILDAEIIQQRQDLQGIRQRISSQLARTEPNDFYQTNRYLNGEDLTLKQLGRVALTLGVRDPSHITNKNDRRKAIDNAIRLLGGNVGVIAAIPQLAPAAADADARFSN